MQSATALMISTSQATAAMIAEKLTQTEGVEYAVVKETKGYRVVQVGPEPKVTTTVAALGGVKAVIKTLDDPHPLGEIAAQVVEAITPSDVFVQTYELRKITPTMLMILVDGAKRTLDRPKLLDWFHAGEQAGHVTIKMTLDQAKKWKLAK